MRGVCRTGRCIESVIGFGAARFASQSCDYPQVRSVLAACVFEKFAYVSSPKCPTLVDVPRGTHAADTRPRPLDCACLMVKDFVCHVRRNPEPSHSGHAGPAQVMKPPFGRHPSELIQPPLSPTEILKSFDAENREDQLLPCLNSLEYDHCLFG